MTTIRHWPVSIRKLQEWIGKNDELSIDGDKVYCNICNKYIICEKKFKIVQHVRTLKHQAQLEVLLSQTNPSFDSTTGLLNKAMPATCLVRSCKIRSNLRSDSDKVSFFRVPFVVDFPHRPDLVELSRRRKEEWLVATKRKNLTERNINNQRVQTGTSRRSRCA